MDSLCYLKAIDKLTLSTMHTHHPSTTPFPTYSAVFEAIHGDPGRISAQRLHSFTNYLPLLKRRRIDGVDDPKMLIENIIADEGKAGESTNVILGCLQRTSSSNICADFRRQIDEIRSKQVINMEALGLRNDVAKWHLGSGEERTEAAPTRALSCPTLGMRSTVTSPTEWDCGKEMSNSRHEPELQRCSSLPGRMTPDQMNNDLQSYFHGKVSLSPRANLSEVSANEVSANNNEQCTKPHQTRVDEDDAINKSDDESCSSGPSTPASCFIDVEDDTSPSSPLNLTTNDNECLDSNNDMSDDTWNSSQTATSIHRPASMEDINKVSDFHNNRDLVFRTELRKSHAETPVSDSLHNEGVDDRKINFSIDAILRPDFGIVRSVVHAAEQENERHIQSSTPEFKGHIKSTQSAFTAVDLSTRPRSDSLSSSSCSSSSLSPPLSTSSPSPLLKSELKHAYEKGCLGQENIFLASKLLPEPSQDFHNFFNSHIPFMNSLHPNTIKSFPFVYTSQTGHQTKLPGIKDAVNPLEYRAKNDENISQYFGRSFYPFINDAHNTAGIMKLPAHQEDQIQHGHDNSCQRKHRHPSADLLPSTKSEKSQNTNSQAKPATRNHDNVAKTDKNMAVNCKVELKQEKAGHGDKAAAADANSPNGNALWPAWVFCTRYSDRPSSGPRSRKPKRSKAQEEKRPRTAFTNEQLGRLKREFEDCRYLTETRRKHLADELGLTESQIKIWFQNKRAKIKKSVGVRNPLALQLMEQGLYNHSTVKNSDESS